jgi:hypothetical protein
MSPLQCTSYLNTEMHYSEVSNEDYYGKITTQVLKPVLLLLLLA